MTERIHMVLAKLAGLKANIDAALAGDISYSWWGAKRTREYVEGCRKYTDELSEHAPDLFGDLPRRNWSFSIGSQKEVLRQAERDIRDVFVRARSAGLWPASDDVPSVSPTKRRPWVVEHGWELLVGLLVAYLAYCFGWNR